MADSSESAILINSATSQVVFEKSADIRRSMASTTKIMTAIVALEYGDLSDIITVPKAATLEEGSSAYLYPDAKMTLEDALYGLMLNSGNDSAVAIAYNISGSVLDFSQLMTDKAKAIGANNTQFKNPNGLESEGHYTTARDLAMITRYALKNPDFKRIVSAGSYKSKQILPDGTEKEIEYINHNRLLKELDGCVGVKTGFTKAAGRCLVSAVERDGSQYIAVTLKDPNDWKSHKEMYDFAFGTREVREVVKKDEVIKHITDGEESGDLVAASDFTIDVNGGKSARFQLEMHIPKAFDFPINKGEKVGYIAVKYGDEVIGTVDVVSKQDFKSEDRIKVKNCFMFTFLTILRNIL